MSLETLQKYVNRRSQEPGIRGRTISPTTIKKELVTLKTAWEWAKESGLSIPLLPNRKRLHFGKTEEKPTFKTWEEIERIIKRGKLSDSAARDYWDCVYLTTEQISDLLIDVDAIDRPTFVHPMFATAALTGARRSELMRSQIEDIDLETSQIRIREKKRIHGRRSTRSVPISPKLHDILVDWFESHPGGISTFSMDGTPLTCDQAHSCFADTLAGRKYFEVGTCLATVLSVTVHLLVLINA